MARSNDGILRYPGGKYFARKMLVSLFPKAIDQYREPMVGGGSIYLEARRAGLANTYWINDFSDPLMSFWSAAQSPELNQELRDACYRWMEKRTDAAAVRKIYKFMRKKQPDSLLAKAVRFFILNRFSFSGTTESGGCSKTAPFDRFTPSSIDRLETLVDLLEGTTITCSSYEHLFDCSPDDFLFLDPPYKSAVKLYGVNGSLHKFDLGLFAERLKEVRGRFLVTLNNSTEVRALFKWANCTQPFKTPYSMNNCGKKTKRLILGEEILIANYDLLFDSARDERRVL